MATLRKGSAGQEVRDLQTALNGKGYSLSVDGIYGDRTAAAVRDYQQKNGLSMVDGIAGNETWGSLRSSTQSTTPTAQTSATEDWKKYSYDASGNAGYQEALKKLQETEKQRPEYEATYDKQLSDLYEKIMNREKFSYDAANDPLYQQYRELYTQQGKQAMQDTMGQAAALTGGYGSTYAQSVGQQQYDAYLQKLGEVVPELYSQARQAYNDEGDRMMQQYQMVGDLRSDEYNKYKDALSDWWTSMNYQAGRADTEYSKGADDYRSALSAAQEAEQQRYTRQQNAYSNLVTLIGSTGYSPSQSELEAAGMSAGEAQKWQAYYNQQRADAARAYASSSSGRSSSSSGSSKSSGSKSSSSSSSSNDLSGYTLVNKNGSGWIALQNKNGRTGGRYSEEEIQRMIARGEVQEIVDHDKKTVTYRKTK